MRSILFFLCSISLITAARAEAPNTGEPAPDVLSLSAVTEAVLANNPSIRQARAAGAGMALANLKAIIGSDAGLFIPATQTTHPKIK
jgi:hypothetical protein